MKKLIKIVALILIMAMATSMLFGCSEGNKRPIQGSDAQSQGNGEENPSGNGNKTEEPDKTEASKATIEEQKCFEYEGIVVTAKSLEYDSIWGESLKLLVENNSDKNIMVSCDALIVNDCMITDLFAADVAAGKKSNETLELSSSQLKAAGIDNIGKIEIYFNVYDNDEIETICKPDCVTIKTSLYDTMDTKADDSGHELYNKGGIRIVGKYVDEDSFWGSSVLLYIENKTEDNIVVQAENLSVNGFMVENLFSATVYSQKYTMDEITLLQSDLDENGITKIEDIELSFVIIDDDSFDRIETTDPIGFKAE